MARVALGAQDATVSAAYAFAGASATLELAEATAWADATDAACVPDGERGPASARLLGSGCPSSLCVMSDCVLLHRCPRGYLRCVAALLVELASCKTLASLSVSIASLIASHLTAFRPSAFAAVS